MKRLLLWMFVCGAACSAFSQSNKDNTLLWRISGKNLSSPSYLFGTIHLLCTEDIELSDSLRAAIKQSNKVYLELDMDNLFEMMTAVQKMKMRNDTTLSDLLSKEKYEKVKAFFKQNGSMIPFSMLETYKPILAASTLMQSNMDCQAEAVEQLVIKEAKAARKEIKGLESMAYQLSIFDSIPYKVQAEQLVEYIENQDNEEEQKKQYEELASAYKNQDLSKMEAITIKEEFGIGNFVDLLLYNRNKKWVEKLQDLLQNQVLVIAVGAGHLPGENGIINLLRKAGYTVLPVQNKMVKTKEERVL